MDPSKPIKHIVQPHMTDLGDFTVKRLLPNSKQRMVGPWIFFDHMGPVTFPAGPGVAVRPHPHVNLATVTYLFEGEILHRDSLGFEQTIQPGDINLMVAGSGIVHSERERKERTTTSRELHGLQLWLALPVAQEETDPEFLHYPASSIPALTVEDVSVRVMIGRAYGMTSPVKTFAETLYVEAEIFAKQSLLAPEGADELAIYIVKGAVQINDEVVEEHSLVIVDAQQVIEITARQDSRIAFIGGENIGSRHVWWNFVSSRRERIEQAKQDWAEGRFPLVPGDEHEFIPLPD